MKTFLMFTLLVVVVYCATVQAREIDAEVVDSEVEEERRFSGTCKEVGQFCNQHCNCCGKDTYCSRSSYCTEGGGDSICQHKSHMCTRHKEKYGAC
nr:venom protein [Lampona murina]